MWKLATSACAQLMRAAAPSLLASSLGALAGVWCASALVPLLVSSGPSALSVTWITALLLLTLAIWPTVRSNITAHASMSRGSVTGVGLAILCWPLCVWGTPLLKQSLQFVPGIGQGLGDVVALLMPIMIQIAICLATFGLLQLLANRQSPADVQPPVKPRLVSTHLGFFLALGAWTLSPVSGWGFWTTHAACAAMLMAAAWFGFVGNRLAVANTSTSEPISLSASRWTTGFTIVALIATGLALPGVWRCVVQLFPETIHIVLGGSLGVLAGTVTSSRIRRGTYLPLFAASGIALWFWCTGSIIDTALWTTATIDQVWRLMLVRMMLAAIPLFCLGLAATSLMNRFPSQLKSVAPLTILAGLAIGNLSLSILGVPSLVSFAMCLIVTGTFGINAAAWFARRSSPAAIDSIVFRPIWRTRLATVSAMALVLVAVSAPLSAWKGYQPEYTARTLFSTSVFEAARNRVDRGGLAMLDEGRCIARTEGTRGVVTVWRHGGFQLQVRENGLPIGSRSLDEQSFPEFSGEVLHSILPIALHERPEHVLISGLGAGQVLESTLAAPVLSVTCVEPRSEILAAYQATSSVEAASRLLADERLRLWPSSSISPLDAPARYDLIIALPDHPTLAVSIASHTREYYRRAAARLSVDGIFSQRLQTIDLGPTTLRGLAATVQAEFSDVLLVEAGPGEMVLCATNSPRGLIRPDLVSRLQADHVRRRLASAGLDWSVVLNHTACSHSQLMQFVVSGHGTPCTTVNPWLLFAFPNETWNWSNKAAALKQTLLKDSGRMADWIADDAANPELVRRLAEVKGQTDLMVKYGDEYWAYRQAVREQVTHKPRSLLKDRSGKSTGLHEEDRRRMMYFQTLAKAIKTRSLDDIERLEAFDRPYDPLLSFFVHAEAAEILAKVKPRQPERELRHRLHTIYYAPPQNRSVRAVVEAMRLVKDFPQAVPDAAQRWDVRNALLQALTARWNARAGIAPASTLQTLGDIDSSLVLSNQLFEIQANEIESTTWSASDWAARKKVLDKYLVAPLEGYLQRVLPHMHQKQLEYAKTSRELTSPPQVDGPDFAPTIPGLPLAN